MEWMPIGEVAKRFDMENARLRDWCNKGLVEFEMRSNARYIPASEFEKIQKILDYFDEAQKMGTRRTFEDVREMLNKENLFVKHEVEVQKKKEVKALQVSIESALSQMGFDEALDLFADKVNEIATKSDLQEIETRISGRLQGETEKREKAEKELAKSNELNEDLKNTLQEMKKQMDSVQSELESLKEASKNNEKQQKRGFLRWFG